MSQIFNIYCDESCHLEHDGLPVMGFGAVICPVEKMAATNAALAALKEKHRARGELKWEKVSPSRQSFYEELIDWFFAESGVRFRGWLVEHKSRLEHEFFNAGSHDSFYYKMYYYLLDPLVRWPQPGEPERTYRIYLDVKDTRSRIMVDHLGKVLRNKKRDKDSKLISRVQSIPAEEVQLMQLTDFLLGALTYRNRPDTQTSAAKLACVARIEQRAGFKLTGGTPPWEEKFNFYTFTPQEVPKCA
jgi:hypothetical protein